MQLKAVNKVTLFPGLAQERGPGKWNEQCDEPPGNHEPRRYSQDKTGTSAPPPVGSSQNYSAPVPRWPVWLAFDLPSGTQIEYSACTDAVWTPLEKSDAYSLKRDRNACGSIPKESSGKGVDLVPKCRLIQRSDDNDTRSSHTHKKNDRSFWSPGDARDSLSSYHVRWKTVLYFISIQSNTKQKAVFFPQVGGGGLRFSVAPKFDS